MGIALDKSGIHTTGFAVRRCSTAYPELRNHRPGHILAAQELAEALDRYSKFWPASARTQKLRGSIDDNRNVFSKARGVVFIQNGWGNVDHIDVWDGLQSDFKGGDRLYAKAGRAVWF